MGKIISIEGIDGAGKTTHSSLLKGYLDAQGIRSSTHHFPSYSSEVGMLIKRVLTKEHYLPLQSLFVLFAANRLEEKERIEGLLLSDHIVILDRYTESELAYGLAHNFPYEWLLNLESQMPKADLVILLDVDAREAIQRSNSRSYQDTFDKSVSLLENVRGNYLSLSVSPPYPNQRWEVIDTSHSVDATQMKIREVLSKMIGTSLH